MEAEIEYTVLINEEEQYSLWPATMTPKSARS